MKVLNYKIGNDIIEVSNDMMTGEETVVFNGQVVSREVNMFTGLHPFTIIDPKTGQRDEFRVEVRMSFMTWTMIATDIFYNDECIYAESLRNRILHRNRRTIGQKISATDTTIKNRVFYREAAPLEDTLDLNRQPNFANKYDEQDLV